MIKSEMPTITNLTKNPLSGFLRLNMILFTMYTNVLDETFVDQEHRDLNKPNKLILWIYPLRTSFRAQLAYCSVFPLDFWHYALVNIVDTLQVITASTYFRAKPKEVPTLGNRTKQWRSLATFSVGQVGCLEWLPCVPNLHRLWPKCSQFWAANSRLASLSAPPATHQQQRISILPRSTTWLCPSGANIICTNIFSTMHMHRYVLICACQWAKTMRLSAPGLDAEQKGGQREWTKSARFVYMDSNNI